MMALALIYSTLISVIIFIPLAFYYYQKQISSPLGYVLYGGATWSLVSIIQYVVLLALNLIADFPLATDYTPDSFIIVMSEMKGILFWYLVFISIIGQVLLYLGTEFVSLGNTIDQYLYFGLGWGISEFIHRFLFFGFDSVEMTFFFLIYTITLSVAIGSTIIRTSENTKFIMFASFLKFFGELSIFGGLGNDVSGQSFLTHVSAVIFLIAFMTSLSILTQKYPLREDTKPVSA